MICELSIPVRSLCGEYMDMCDGGIIMEEVVLCGASSYTEKYYFNEQFNSLPQSIKDELHIMCVLFTADVGGAIQVVFEEDGSLQLRTQTEEGDILYDEIGSVLKIKQLQREKEELFESLEMYYRVFCLNEPYEGEC